jgi:hypothetical protein
LLVAMALTAIFAIIAAAKSVVLANLILGAMVILVLGVLQYVADKFCDALERLNRNTTGHLSSTTFPDCFAMISKLVGAVILLSSIVAAAESGQYSLILFGAATFLVAAYLAVVGLNLAALNISVVPGLSTDDEALGVLAFLGKAFLRLVPVIFGVGVVCGTLMTGYACWLAISAKADVPGSMLAVQMAVGAGRSSLLLSAALPPAAYVLFLLYWLAIGLCRAILGLPTRHD